MRLSYALILLPFALAAPVADLAEPVEGPDLAARAERKAPFNQCEKLISYGVDMGNGDIFHSFSKYPALQH
jgi:hypothetical protein